MAREYDIAGTSGQCSACRKELARGEEFVAVLFDAGDDFRREDFCTACWGERSGQVGEYFSCWQGRLPEPEEPTRPVVNVPVLMDFLDRLAGSEEPSHVNFRFVLALMLMRKKLLVYDGRGTEPQGHEVWRMHFRANGRAVQVVRAELDEEKIADVSRNLAQIFQVSP